MKSILINWLPRNKGNISSLISFSLETNNLWEKNISYWIDAMKKWFSVPNVTKIVSDHPVFLTFHNKVIKDVNICLYFCINYKLSKLYELIFIWINYNCILYNLYFILCHFFCSLYANILFLMIYNIFWFLIF